MKDAAVHIYQGNNNDDIYVEVMGLSPKIQCEITLFKNRNALKSLKGFKGVFYNQGTGYYKAAIILTATDGSLATLLSNALTLSPATDKRAEQAKEQFADYLSTL